MGLQDRPWTLLIDNINDARFSYYIQEKRGMYDDALDSAVKPFEWRPIANWAPRKIALSFKAPVDGSDELQPQLWIFTPATSSDAAYQQLGIFME
jgi:hypothetical protein